MVRSSYTTVVRVDDTEYVNMSRIPDRAKNLLDKMYLPYIDIGIYNIQKKSSSSKHSILPNGFILKQNSLGNYDLSCWCYRKPPIQPRDNFYYFSYPPIDKRWEKIINKCIRYRQMTIVATVYSGTTLKFSEKDVESYQIFLNKFHQTVSRKKTVRKTYRRKKKDFKREGETGFFYDVFPHRVRGYPLPQTDHMY
jgi:hypothetical protein